jgi:hypothetical protein
MRLKKPSAVARVCALVFVVVVSAMALVAVPALALPEGRHYELVSPPYKAGYGVAEALEAAASDGESVAFLSQGVFAGAPTDQVGNAYVARRGASEWQTTSLEPPATMAPSGIPVDFTPTLDSILWRGTLAPNGGTAEYESPETVFLRHLTGTADVQENWQVAGRVVETLDKKHFKPAYIGASPDFCHILFIEEGGGQLVSAAVGTEAEVYDLSTGCGDEPVSLGVVGLNNQGKVLDSYCKERIGGFHILEPEGAGQNEVHPFNAIADGGREVFFSDFVEPSERGAGCTAGTTVAAPGNPAQVFVRLDGSRTVEVSRPLEAGAFGGCEKGGVPGEVPCKGASKRAPALFWGASEDGSKVFFTTPAPLTGEGDETNNLYMATIGCPGGMAEGCEVTQRQVTSLTRVSQASLVGGGAGVQGVVKIAPDGSHVYFVARGVLSEERGVEGAVAVKGADNMYVYDSTSGRVAFIADLCSGSGLSGGVADGRCPSSLESKGPGGRVGGEARNDVGLWKGEEGNGQPEAKVNVCGMPSTGECGGVRETGRFLVFSTYAQLIGHGLQADTDNAKDVYRYDAQAGALDRVSLGEEGHVANGNCNDAAAGAGGVEVSCDAEVVSPIGSRSTVDTVHAQLEMDNRAISEDGSRIVFRSTAPLSVDATNGLVNVYEWHQEPGWGEGRVSLVSSGTSQTADSGAVITPSGGDIFFVTSQGLVPRDTDGQADVYDARLGAGFPPVPEEPQPCSGDACQGPLTDPAALLVPGTVSQAPGGNFAAPAVTVTVAAKKAKPPKRKAKTKKRRKRSGRASGHTRRAVGSAGRSGR